MPFDALPTNSDRAIAALPPWHKKPKAYGRPLIQYIRRANVRVVWAWRSGEWTPDLPRRQAPWPRLPDSKQGRDMAFVFAVAQLRCQPEEKTREMLATLVRWMDAEEREKVLARARKYGKAGRGIGRQIKLTEEERQACKVWWLASEDGDMSRAMSRRIDGRQARKERRQKEGAITQEEYFARPSERKNKPWEALGMSRSTWQRKGKPAGQMDGGPDAPTSYNTEGWSVGASGPRAVGAPGAHTSNARGPTHADGESGALAVEPPIPDMAISRAAVAALVSIEQNGLALRLEWCASLPAISILGGRPEPIHGGIVAAGATCTTPAHPVSP